MEQLKQYIPLCWFKGYLDEIPESMSLFRSSLIFYIVVGIFIRINTTGFIEAIIQVVFEVFLTFLFVAILLFFAKSMKKYWRVMTAYLLCQDFISLFGLPLLMWVTVSDETWSYYSLAIILVWAIAIIAYINNQLITLGIFSSTLLSLTYYLGIYGGAFVLLLLFV